MYTVIILFLTALLDAIVGYFVGKLLDKWLGKK